MSLFLQVSMLSHEFSTFLEIKEPHLKKEDKIIVVQQPKV